MSVLHRLARSIAYVPRIRSTTSVHLRHAQILASLPNSPTSRRFQHSYRITPLTPDEYEKVSDVALDNMLESLENLMDEGIGADENWEVSYSSGVLTLSLGPRGTYVINKQPPNSQIWLSSPVSGPKRFDYSAEHGRWFYNRDGSTLKGLLDEEVGAAAGQPVDLKIEETDS